MLPSYVSAWIHIPIKVKRTYVQLLEFISRLTSNDGHKCSCWNSHMRVGQNTCSANCIGIWLPLILSGFSNKTKELSMLSLVPKIILTNKHKYFFKLRYKILSAVTRKYSKLSINLPEEAVKRFHREDRYHYLLDIIFLHLDNCRINCTWNFP